MHNNISFRSNIRFVNQAQTDELYKRISKDRRYCAELLINSGNHVFNRDFYTVDVRTCTAGNIKGQNHENFGFHFFHSGSVTDEAVELIGEACRRFVPERAFLIGAKALRGYPFSMENFETFYNVISNFTKNISIFKQHKFLYSESDIHYSNDTDTYTILSQYAEIKNMQKFKDITSLSELLKCFDTVQIAKGDRLFINDKEILPQDCPSIFKDAKTDD